ncbi:MAG: formylglycine-generating enzyme family protein, partial [Actinomycetia bacterium]|nr:formylglycine-generating enzyme family protein [Actinomycetes bacterium]
MLTDLVELEGGAFRMGSTQFYPEETPVHTVTVAPF